MPQDNQEHNHLKFSADNNVIGQINEDSNVIQREGIQSVEIDEFAQSVGSLISDALERIPAFIIVGLLTDLATQLTLQRVSEAARQARQPK